MYEEFVVNICITYIGLNIKKSSTWDLDSKTIDNNQDLWRVIMFCSAVLKNQIFHYHIIHNNYKVPGKWLN